MNLSQPLTPLPPQYPPPHHIYMGELHPVIIDEVPFRVGLVEEPVLFRDGVKLCDAIFFLVLVRQ